MFLFHVFRPLQGSFFWLKRKRISRRNSCSGEAMWAQQIILGALHLWLWEPTYFVYSRAVACLGRPGGQISRLTRVCQSRCRARDFPYLPIGSECSRLFEGSYSTSMLQVFLPVIVSQRLSRQSIVRSYKLKYFRCSINRQYSNFVYLKLCFRCAQGFGSQVPNDLA